MNTGTVLSLLATNRFHEPLTSVHCRACQSRRPGLNSGMHHRAMRRLLSGGDPGCHPNQSSCGCNKSLWLTFRVTERDISLVLIGLIIQYGCPLMCEENVPKERLVRVPFYLVAHLLPFFALARSASALNPAYEILPHEDSYGFFRSQFLLRPLQIRLLIDIGEARLVVVGNNRKHDCLNACIWIVGSLGVRHRFGPRRFLAVLELSFPNFLRVNFLPATILLEPHLFRQFQINRENKFYSIYEGEIAGRMHTHLIGFDSFDILSWAFVIEFEESHRPHLW